MAATMPVTMPAQAVLPDPRFNSIAPIGRQTLASVAPAPVGNVGGQRAVPLLRAQNESADGRIAPNPQGLGDLSLPGGSPDWSSLVSGIHDVTSSIPGQIATYAMLGAAPPLGLAMLGANYFTRPESFVAQAVKDSGGGQASSRDVSGGRSASNPQGLGDYGGKSSGLGNANGGGNSSDHSGFGGSSFNDHSLGGMSFGDRSDPGHDLNTHDFNDTGGFSFAKGGVVPGAGPKKATVHGGEVVMPRKAVKGAGGGSMKRGQKHLMALMKALSAKGRSRT